MPRQTRRKKQRGGNKKEPLLFHYTLNPARRLWTCLLYPHSGVLLNAIKTIPWADWSFEGDGLSAKFHEPNAYVLKGGVVTELYAREFKKAGLNNSVDPTADIDVVILPPKLRAAPNSGKNAPATLFVSDSSISKSEFNSGRKPPIQLHTPIQDSMRWILERLGEYFQRYADYFEKFIPAKYLPTIDWNDRDQVRALFKKEIAEASPDLPVIFVKPFILLCKLYWNPAVDSMGEIREYVPEIKIQVKLALNVGDETYIDHPIEISFKSPGEKLPASVFLPRMKVWVRGLPDEIKGNVSALASRAVFLHDDKPSAKNSIHKFYNHVYRLAFLFPMYVHDAIQKKDNAAEIHAITENYFESMAVMILKFQDYLKKYGDGSRSKGFPKFSEIAGRHLNAVQVGVDVMKDQMYYIGRYMLDHPKYSKSLYEIQSAIEKMLDANTHFTLRKTIPFEKPIVCDV